VWSGGYRSRGHYNADYLTVEHESGLDLPDELILRRRSDPSSTSNVSRRKHGGPSAARRRTPPAVFSVQRLDNEQHHSDDDDEDFIAVHEISRNIFVASTQFERPFDYSTSTWSELLSSPSS